MNTYKSQPGALFTMHALVVLHRARSKSTIGFSPDSFSSMARLELASSLNGLPHELSSCAIEAPLLSFSTLVLVAQHDAALVSAVSRCSLTHAVFEPLGAGEDAAGAAAVRLKARSWTSWSLRAMVLGAKARPTKLERAALLGPTMEAPLSAALAPALRCEVTGAADWRHRCRLVALFGASGGTQLLRHVASGAAVSTDGYDYIVTGTPHVHGHLGLLGAYSAATRPTAVPHRAAPLAVDDDDDEHSAIPATRCPPMCAELALLMANLALNGRSMASVLDPCAGGGSLLIAAALVGATRVQASDADPRAATRTAAAFGAAFGDGGGGSGEGAPSLELRTCDVAALLAEAEQAVAGAGAAEPLDAIICDPPYGIKAASLGARDLVLARVLALAARRLRPGGRLVILVPSSSAGPRARTEEGWREAAEAPAALSLLGDWEQTFSKGGLARRLRLYERIADVAPPLPSTGLSSERTRWEGGGLPDRRRVRPRRGRVG